MSQRGAKPSDGAGTPRRTSSDASEESAGIVKRRRSARLLNRSLSRTQQEQSATPSAAKSTKSRTKSAKSGGETTTRVLRSASKKEQQKKELKDDETQSSSTQAGAKRGRSARKRGRRANADESDETQDAQTELAKQKPHDEEEPAAKKAKTAKKAAKKRAKKKRQKNKKKKQGQNQDASASKDETAAAEGAVPVEIAVTSSARTTEASGDSTESSSAETTTHASESTELGSAEPAKMQDEENTAGDPVQPAAEPTVTTEQPVEQVELAEEPVEPAETAEKVGEKRSTPSANIESDPDYEDEGRRPREPTPKRRKTLSSPDAKPVAQPVVPMEDEEEEHTQVAAQQQQQQQREEPPIVIPPSMLELDTPKRHFQPVQVADRDDSGSGSGEGIRGNLSPQLRAEPLLQKSPRAAVADIDARDFSPNDTRRRLRMRLASPNAVRLRPRHRQLPFDVTMSQSMLASDNEDERQRKYTQHDVSAYAADHSNVETCQSVQQQTASPEQQTQGSNGDVEDIEAQDMSDKAPVFLLRDLPRNAAALSAAALLVGAVASHLNPTATAALQTRLGVSTELLRLGAAALSQLLFEYAAPSLQLDNDLTAPAAQNEMHTMHDDDAHSEGTGVGDINALLLTARPVMSRDSVARFFPLAAVAASTVSGATSVSEAMTLLSGTVFGRLLALHFRRLRNDTSVPESAFSMRWPVMVCLVSALRYVAESLLPSAHAALSTLLLFVLLLAMLLEFALDSRSRCGARVPLLGEWRPRQLYLAGTLGGVIVAALTLGDGADMQQQQQQQQQDPLSFAFLAVTSVLAMGATYWLCETAQDDLPLPPATRLMRHVTMDELPDSDITVVGGDD
ncbi:MAG: hypothetical protein MHM6MM_004648 [Cercozoa sp. M6MM]